MRQAKSSATAFFDLMNQYFERFLGYFENNHYLCKDFLKTMNKYALFFDIDGTLVSFETHQIPPSTILALTQAKANGHKVFIATGRPPIIITNLGAIEHLIDGYVTTNGALCFIGEQTVSCHAIPQDAAQLIVDDSREKDYGLIVVGERDVAVLDPKEPGLG